MREQVRRSKREAEAQRIRAEALVSRTRASAEERRIRREVMLAWIDAVAARANQKLLGMAVADLQTGRKVAEAGVSTGSSNSATVLEADAEIALRQAELAAARGAEARARAELFRWIGISAERELPDTLPKIELPTDFAQRLSAVGGHPELQVVQAQQEAAARQVDVARRGREWDLSWSVSLGIRPKYGEMVSASVSIPLQSNRRNRQERQVAAAQERTVATALRLQDAARELGHGYHTAIADYRSAEAELTRVDREALPALESAFDVAEARYAAGAGTVDQPFALVRRYSEARLQSIEAHARRERAAAEIVYVLGETGR